ncbi:MAG: hypothetical protein FWC16_14290 [Defluviitaleaceae bacterium]|nr:hypothetical protein [Defluviitaleaceae bacterium]MCL2276083.1 hypothetical protein [Defluviitaleaceae bacterium]
MNKKIKPQLKNVFTAPAATRKQAFFLVMESPRLSRVGFIITQIGYIRKRVWAASFALVVSVFIGIQNIYNMDLFIFSLAAFLPFFALLGITELAKSASFQMEELEASCRFSLADITLARLGILGLVNFVVLLIISFFISFAYLALLFTPYLMCCALSLFFINRFRGFERVQVCGIISVMVSASSIFIFYINLFFPWMLAALILWTAFEIFTLINKLEEITCNSSLTA